MKIRKMNVKLDDWFTQNVSNPQRLQMLRHAYADFRIRNSKKLPAIWELMKSTVLDSGSLAAVYGRFDLNYLAIFREYNFAVRALSGKNRLIRALKK